MEEIMRETRAKVTEYRSGAIVINPYRKTNQKRYDPLLVLPNGELSQTKDHYRLLVMLPKSSGVTACIGTLVENVTMACNYLTKLLTHITVKI